jgi:hypothetical protein
MLARFLKFVSNNPLAATIVGTIIGGWILTQLLAVKAPDVGGVFGAVGRWLRAPAGSTRVDEITLALVSILLGFISCAALFLREAQKRQQRERQTSAAAAPAPTPPRARPDDWAPTVDAVVPAPDVARLDSTEAYFSGVRALRGRFAEIDEYLRRCTGKTVRWRGTVRSVKGFADNSVVVYLRGESGQLTLMSVDFPATFRERVLALLPGDTVLVTGRFIKGDEDMVQIDGDGFELLKRTSAV